jgi:hypothetical protein
MRRGHVWICTVTGLLFAALPYVAAAPASSGDDLGRLFTSRSERMEIDRARTSLRADAATPIESAAKLSPDGAATSRARMRVDGMVVRRGGGDNDLWLNGGRAKSAAGVDGDNRVPVRVPGTDHMVWMKPGQVLDTSTGTVRESYQAGQ